MKDYTQVNKVIAKHTNQLKEVFYSKNDATEKLSQIEGIRALFLNEVECFGLSRNIYSTLLDKVLILLGMNGVQDVRIEGSQIYVDIDGRKMNQQDNINLFKVLEQENFTLARIKTRLWKQKEGSKDLAVFMFPRKGLPTKYYSKEQGAKAYGY